MKTVQEHYASHLAPIYVWMVGGAEAAFAHGEAETEALGLPQKPGDAVLDLGAGFGVHAIPMARRGARVTAVDTSDELLAALRELAGNTPIQTVQMDLVCFLQQYKDRYAAIVCMGDTLTHLCGVDKVEELFVLAHEALLPGGRLVLGFRDYSTVLEEEQRFIPVKSDDARMLTCFLEFGDAAIKVHDIVHEKSAQGWQMRVSAYNKLRLVPAELAACLEKMGFAVRIEAGLRGMVRLVAVRP